MEEDNIMQRIERTLFWFLDGDQQLDSLNERHFGLSNLLNRLLNQRYRGKKIKFINIKFGTPKTYEIYPTPPPESYHLYDGHLNIYGFIDLDAFNKLSHKKQQVRIWKKAFEYLCKVAIGTENSKLHESIQFAYETGLDTRLNCDYRIFKETVVYQGSSFEASMWIHFNVDEMRAVLKLTKDGSDFFQRTIDKSRLGISFFIEKFTGITQDKKYLIIKAHSDVEGFPLKFSLEEINSEWRNFLKG